MKELTPDDPFLYSVNKELLVSILIQNNMTPMMLADDLGFTQQTVSEWLRDRKLPRKCHKLAVNYLIVMDLVEYDAEYKIDRRHPYARRYLYG